jgi:glycosyltransferase involved in cell wall biosynthesis
MKIAFIANGKLPIPASQGGAVETLIQILLDHNEKKHKHDITVYTSYNDTSIEMSKKYKFSKFVLIETKDKWFKIGRIFRYIINRIPYVYIGNEFVHRVKKTIKLSKEKYDFVIIENSPEYALILKEHFQNNLVLHLHNDFLNKDKFLSHKILNSYNKVFTLSDYVNYRVQEIDYSFKKIYTVHNGIEIDKFNKAYDVIKLRSKYNIDKDDFVFLYTGRIVPEKGVKELILAFCKICSTPKMKLLIVGDMHSSNIKLKKYINEIKSIRDMHSNILSLQDMLDMKIFLNIMQ